jgi:hypothetical protein
MMGVVCLEFVVGRLQTTYRVCSGSDFNTFEQRQLSPRSMYNLSSFTLGGTTTEDDRERLGRRDVGQTGSRSIIKEDRLQRGREWQSLGSC